MSTHEFRRVRTMVAALVTVLAVGVSAWMLDPRMSDGQERSGDNPKTTSSTDVNPHAPKTSAKPLETPSVVSGPPSSATATDASSNGMTVDQLLQLAGRDLGCGFIYGDDLLTGSRSARVNFTPPSGRPSESWQPTLMLYECLRTVGLVAMPVRGLQPPVYRVVSVNEAASYGPVARDIAELDGWYFGTLALEANVLSLEQTRELVKRFAGPHAHITAIDQTSLVVISDYVENLTTIWNAVCEAETPVERDDDVVTELFKPVTHDPSGLRTAAEDARQSSERYTVTLHEPSGTLLVTGTRRDATTALARLAELDATPCSKDGVINLHVYVRRSRPMEEVMTNLKEFFAADIARGSMRLGVAPDKRGVLLECSAPRHAAALRLLDQIDPAPVDRLEYREGLK